MYRTADFRLTADTLPESTRPAYAALRTFFALVGGVAKAAKADVEKIESDRHLSAEGRADRRATIAESLRASVEQATRTTLEAIGPRVRLIREHVDKQLDAGAFEQLPSGEGAATRILAVRIDALARIGVRAEVDRMLDRALASDDPDGAIQRVFTEREDPVLAHALETHGARRIREEGSMVQMAIVDAAVNSLRESRMTDEHRLLLDHADVLAQAAEFAEKTAAEALHPRFLETGGELFSPQGARVLLGSAILEEV